MYWTSLATKYSEYAGVREKEPSDPKAFYQGSQTELKSSFL